MTFPYKYLRAVIKYIRVNILKNYHLILTNIQRARCERNRQTAVESRTMTKTVLYYSCSERSRQNSSQPINTIIAISLRLSSTVSTTVERAQYVRQLCRYPRSRTSEYFTITYYISFHILLEIRTYMYGCNHRKRIQNSLHIPTINLFNKYLLIKKTLNGCYF